MDDLKLSAEELTHLWEKAQDQAATGIPAPFHFAKEVVELHTRRAMPQANAEQDARQFLQPNDLATLHRFMDFCTDSDAGGYSIPKERMQRLAEIGAIESKGFGRYQVTTFGLYVLTIDADGSANLPLKTYAEYDADCMAAHEAKIFGGAASNATRGSDHGNAASKTTPSSGEGA